MTTHGHTRQRKVTPLYRAWTNMRTRCGNPKSSHYPDYGGRGISVCPQWESFETFASDVGARPSQKHSLDRINTNGNYEPNNVRWATQKEQCRNKRTSRPVVRSDGERFNTMTAAAESIGGSHKEIWNVCNGKGKTHRGYGWSYV